MMPSSSTTAVTYLIPISCSLLLTRPTSVHYCSKKEKRKKKEDSHQYHHNYSCTFSFLKLGTPKSYLEGHMIILGINRTWFDDGVKLMINWWVLNQMYSDTIIVQPAFNQTFNVISFLKLNYERIFNVWKCKASKWTYQAPLKLKEEGRLMRTKPRTSS
jgi:hypothetical protein